MWCVQLAAFLQIVLDFFVLLFVTQAQTEYKKSRRERESVWQANLPRLEVKKKESKAANVIHIHWVVYHRLQ